MTQPGQVLAAHGGTGLDFDGHDPADYARAMSRLVSAPGYRDRLGSAAALHARGFAWERTADLTLDVYRKAARAMRHDLTLGAMHG